MARSTKTLERISERTMDLTDRFSHYVDVFESAEKFTGPSVYFHVETLRRLREHGDIGSALRDDTLLDHLYATLTSWGMHRMGPGGAKLAAVEVFRQSLRSQSEQLESLEGSRLDELTPRSLDEVSRQLWEIIGGLEVATGKTKLIAGSKAVHHLLPDLQPPIDRQYTLRFFFDHTTLNAGDEATFKDIYPHFHTIAVSCRDEIGSRVGAGFNTGPTKVIDNAIVGWVTQNLD